MHRLLHYSYIYLIPLFFSALFSLRSFRLKWPKALKVFSCFLITTAVVEAFAIAWKWELYKTGHWRLTNLWIYNAFLPVRHLFYLWFFYETITSAIVKKMTLLSALPVFIFGVINYFFIQGPHAVSTYTIIIENIITIVLVLVFFYQVLRNKNIIRLSASAEIWICLGTFIYYSGTLPFFMLFNYLLTRHLNIASSYLYINDALNVIMYLFFLIAFLCKPHPLK